MTQLNRAASDLPGSLLMRWITYIKMFDFTVKYVLGIKHTIADSLSRRLCTNQDTEEQALKGEIDDFIDTELMSVRIALIRAQITGS